MPEIKKIYCQALPAMRFVGKRYDESEKENGTFANKWKQWFQNDLFAPLQLPNGDAEPFEDCNAYYGLSRCREGEPCQYWIGAFLPLTAPTPDGYDSLTFGAGEIAVCWVYGKEPDVYLHCCLSELKKAGYEWIADKDGARWCFERYVRSRFGQPDEQGNLILDSCFYIRFAE